MYKQLDPTLSSSTQSERLLLEPTKSSKLRSSILLLALLSIALATVVAYQPVLFNFFAGDDFVHLTWLKDAVQNPELIWRNFHSSWLDGTTARFYRPLISIFMVLDYKIWGLNGFGFHLTNLIFHLTSSLLIYGIVLHISSSRILEQKAKQRGIENQSWAIAAGALFALYPLHSEAVAWITGRVDAIVTTFCLLSLFSYICWRQSNHKRWFAATSLTMILALMSKEMAMTLPAIFLAYEMVFARSSHHLNSEQKTHNWRISLTNPSVVLAAKKAIKPTLFFWILLVGYFLVRRMALGTFVGGYDDSLVFISNWRGFLFGWIHGLTMMIIPINKDLMGAHSPLTRIWQATLAASVVFVCLTTRKHLQLLRPLIFVAVWFVLCLAPVYKIFTIADDLQSSRLAYLATAPLCIFITSAFFKLSLSFQHFSGKQYFRFGTLCMLIASAGLLLWNNNQAWLNAGLKSNAIRLQLKRFYTTHHDDPQVLIVGLPDNIQGAYVCRNALWGMTKSPQLTRDIVNCLMVDRFEPILPFGYLKDSIARNKDKIVVLRWSGDKDELIPVTFNQAKLTEKNSAWNAGSLHKILRPIQSKYSTYAWLPDGALVLEGTQGFRGRPKVAINLNGWPCWSIDFLCITVETIGTQSSTGADILYLNDLNPVSDLRRRTHGEIVWDNNTQTLIFPLHGLPEWALGGTCHGLELILPDKVKTKIKDLRIVSPQKIMPQIYFPNSGYLGTKGFIHLSHKVNTSKVSVDVTNIPNSSGFIIEITRPNLLFSAQNAVGDSSSVMTTIQRNATSGTVTLSRTMFPSAGIYQIRARTLGTDLKPIALASDHLVVSIDD